MREEDILVVFSSGYIGSREEAQTLHKEWLSLEELYADFGLRFVVAPRCDDADGVSRKGLWEYSELFRDFLLGQPRGRELVLVNFSAGGPIADMGIIRARGSPKPKPRIAATFYVEATHIGISSGMVRRFNWPGSRFIDDLEPRSRFMEEVARFRPAKPRNCVEVSGRFAELFPITFGPRTETELITLPEITHGELEYSWHVHFRIIMRIQEILRRSRRTQ